MIHSKNIKLFLTVGILVLIHFSCQTKSKEKEEVNPTPDTVASTMPYDFEKPDKKWVVPDSLLEISGIAWIGENKMMAVEDLRPLLYKLNLGDTSAGITDKLLFKKTEKDKYDMEDLVVIKDTVYALYSHGKIFKIWNDKKQIMVTEIKTELDKDNNTEGLAYDPVSGNLLIACKEESDVEDEKKSTRVIFEFDIKKYLLKAEPFLLIHKKDFEGKAVDKVEFYPSGIAVHPSTHDLFILSTKDTKCIAQFSHAGQLKAFSYFNKALMPQPEGICFDPQGNLYISTEGRHGKPACIYKFVAKNK